MACCIIGCGLGLLYGESLPLTGRQWISSAQEFSFASGTLIGGALGMGLYSSLFLLPMFLQQLLGYPAYDSGLIIMPRALAMAIAMPVGGHLYNRIGPKPLIITGLLICSVCIWKDGVSVNRYNF